jgi:hypothetical protein
MHIYVSIFLKIGRNEDTRNRYRMTKIFPTWITSNKSNESISTPHEISWPKSSPRWQDHEDVLHDLIVLIYLQGENLPKIWSGHVECAWKQEEWI